MEVKDLSKTQHVYPYTIHAPKNNRLQVCINDQLEEVKSIRARRMLKTRNKSSSRN
jgi:hypothetical protein